MAFVSFAQNFEDVMLYRVFAGRTSGIYVDVGAHDPNIESVTRAFYERGWWGVNVEPLQEAFIRLNEFRTRDINLNVAAGRETGMTILHALPGTGLSTICNDVVTGYQASGQDVASRQVSVRTLTDICENYQLSDIQFLKIDVEGSEFDVLSGADFERFRPEIVVVEATIPLKKDLSFNSWEPILLEARYRFVWFDGLNRFYVAEEFFDLHKRHFLVPVNVFDDFVLDPVLNSLRFGEGFKRKTEEQWESDEALELLSESSSSDITLSAADRRVGTMVGRRGKYGIELDGRAGVAVFRPFVRLAAGNYVAQINFGLTEVVGTALMDVASRSDCGRLGFLVISSESLRDGRAEISFSTDSAEVEVRLFSDSGFQAKILSISIASKMLDGPDLEYR